MVEFNKNEIIRILKERGAVNPCHRCGATEFSVLDGYSMITIQKNLKKGIVIGGPAVPVISIACSNCGAITFHALGALELLPQKNEKEE